MMKSRHNKRFANAAMILSILLIISSAIIVAAHYISQSRAADGAVVTAEELKQLMPEIKYGTADETGDVEMAVMELDGTDYIGILEVPKYDKVLPVCSTWNKRGANRCPCRFSGSLYDKSLIIGAAGNSGQFDIIGVLSHGDEVSVTDMAGSKYTYVITDMYKTKDVSAANLGSQEADLLLFVKDAYGMEYMMISCSSR